MLTTLNNHNCNYYFTTHIGDVKIFLVGHIIQEFQKQKKEKLRMHVYDLKKLKYRLYNIIYYIIIKLLNK